MATTLASAPRLVLQSCLLALFAAACSSGEPQPDPDAGNDCPASEDCSADGIECGPIYEGAACVRHCGGCAAPASCGGGGTPNVCGCRELTCEGQGFECGSFQEGCSGMTIDCGTCSGGLSCGGGGEANKCGRQAALGEDCSGAGVVCGAGLACCEGSAGQICQEAEANGACPPPLPDVVIDAFTLASTLQISTEVFDTAHCAFEDGCLRNGPGTYKLLRFATKTTNISDIDLVMGRPEDRPDKFTFMQCHEHYHWASYVEHRLVDMNGNQVAESHKASFCIEDVGREDPSAPMTRRFACEDPLDPTQGLQAGWYDLYEATLDCQWIDITNVPPGDYIVELEVNPDRGDGGFFRESNYENNTATATITIP